MENHHFLVGKLTRNGIFNSFLYVYQRVCEFTGGFPPNHQSRCRGDTIPICPYKIATPYLYQYLQLYLALSISISISVYIYIYHSRSIAISTYYIILAISSLIYIYIQIYIFCTYAIINFPKTYGGSLLANDTVWSWSSHHGIPEERLGVAFQPIPNRDGLNYP